MRHRVVWLILCALGFQVALWWAPAAADQSDLANRDWSVKAADGLATHPPSKESIAALLSELVAADPSSSDADEIDSVHFVDLNHSGTFSLVVEQGAFRCGGAEVDIVDKTTTGFELYRTGGEGRPQTDKILQDINGDGNFELVDDETLIFRDCASYEVVFPVIYAWTGAGYGNVSDRFRDFYRHKLETLNSRLATIDAKKQAIAARGLEGLPTCDDESGSTQAGLSSGDAGAREGSPSATESASPPAGGAINEIRPVGPRFSLGGQNCVPASLEVTNEESDNENNWKIEAAKIERFLGPSRDAGIGYAIKLSHGDDWRDRMLAAEIFGDIPTGEARDYLLKLSHDDEAPVAAAARKALDSPSFHPDDRLTGKAVSFKDLEAAAAQPAPE